MRTIVLKSMEYGIKCHQEANKTYGKKEIPYSFHLARVAYYVQKFSHLLPSTEVDIVISAAWCHDVIEDTGNTYNDLKNATSKEVADLVYLVTNELGRNRDERHVKTLPKIASSPIATYLKLCDRMANIEYSTYELEQVSQHRKTMLQKYNSEHYKFKEALYLDEHIIMWKYLESLQ